MWTQCKKYSNLEVTREGKVRRKILSKFDNTIKFSIDGYYYPDIRITDNGYQVVSQGAKGHKHSEESKQKMRQVALSREVKYRKERGV